MERLAPKRSMRLLESLLLILALTSPRLSAQTLTITNATVIDVSNGALRRDQTIVIDGNRIVSVGSSPAPAAARGQVVDAKGMYVIPGLWDMHTHAYFGWSRDFGDSYVLPLFIANGVTGIRDMGSDLDAVLRARKEVAAHRLVGPRMVVSGPMLDGPRATYRGVDRRRHSRRWTEGRAPAESARAPISSRSSPECRATRISPLRTKRRS